MKLPEWLIKFVGKRVVKDGIEKTGLSKAKLAAIIYVIVVAIQTLCPVMGSDFVIPAYVFRILEGIGLWSVRDAIK